MVLLHLTWPQKRWHVVALHVTMVFCPVAGAQDTVGTGVVREEVVRSDETPGDFFQVCIAGTGLCSPGDQNGCFAPIDAHPGLLQLEVRIKSCETVPSGTVHVRAGQTSEVRLGLPDVAAIETSVTGLWQEYAFPSNKIGFPLLP